MTDPAPAPAPAAETTKTSHQDRVKAVQTAALVNLLKKAQQGKTLTATDWKELRRLASEAGLSGDPPWVHEQLQGLATAVGVTVRTLESWRTKGAPLTVDGPHDELRLRLWHLTLPAGKRTRALSEPRETLAPYLALVSAATTAVKTAAADAKPRKAKLEEEKLAWQVAASKGKLVAEAEQHYLRRVGDLERVLLRDLTGIELPKLWRDAQGERAVAEPKLIQRIRQTLARCLREVLGGSAPTPVIAPPPDAANASSTPS